MSDVHGPTGNPPPGAKTGMPGFAATLLGVSILAMPVTMIVSDTDDPVTQDSEVCEWWSDEHPDVEQSSLGCE